MSSIRDMAKTAGMTAAAGGAAGLAAGGYSGKDLSTSLDMGAYGAAGATAGLAAGAGWNYAKKMPSAIKAGFGGGGWGGFTSALKSAGTSGWKMATGGALGALAGMGYATLNANKPMNYNDRLNFETKRKKMVVEENLRQMREMRQIMQDTRMR
jgi:hypothetical protein